MHTDVCHALSLYVSTNGSPTGHQFGCTDLLAVVGVRSVEELDAGEGAGELAAAGDPADGGALVKEEARVEELDALLLDEAHAQHLALLLIRNQLGG